MTENSETPKSLGEKSIEPGKVFAPFETATEDSMGNFASSPLMLKGVGLVVFHASKDIQSEKDIELIGFQDPRRIWVEVISLEENKKPKGSVVVHLEDGRFLVGIPEISEKSERITVYNRWTSVSATTNLTPDSLKRLKGNSNPLPESRGSLNYLEFEFTNRFEAQTKEEEIA